MSEENNQLALIEAESDDALFLDNEDMRKRYTGTTVDRIAMKRDRILDLLAAGLSVDSIATRVGSSSRTVTLLGAKYAQQIAQDIPTFAKALRGTAAKALAIAAGKLEGAKLGELAVFIGVTTQRAGEMELAAAGVTEENIVNVEEASPALQSARDFVLKLQPPKPEDLPQKNAETAEKNNQPKKEQNENH